MSKLEKRYKPAELEEKIRNFWEAEDIYKYKYDPSKPMFSVDTPPPYVSSAHLHVGHAISYSQAEFVIRFFRMMGYNVYYPMGFDDNGLPTERFVEKKHKINKSKIKRSDFIELCLKETKEGGKTYEKLWRALGLSVDWSLLYSTINEKCRRISQRSFIDLFSKGRIQRKNDPMIWCPRCQTAIAQAEIETEEKPSTLNYINFGDKENEYIIATTRPELIPSCVALFVNPNDERYKDLIGKEVVIPITNHQVKVMADEDVDIEFGSGLMQVCTWGDFEDVNRWRENNLDTRLFLDKNGVFTEEAGPIAGMKIIEAREKVMEILESQGRVVKKEALNHNVGVHERCGTIVEFYMTPQWFIKVLDVKEEMLKRGNELKWYPAYYKTQYDNWVENLKWDWCISRQRYYGVPFPVWYCAKCEEIIVPDDKALPVDPTQDSPSIDTCPKCGHKEFIGEKDVMDTWMTSSLTPLINALWKEEVNRENQVYPMTVRVQGFEIIRTWLFYTVVKSHFHTDSLPWETVMISGWGLDEHGKKMSKSKGNFVTPDFVMNKYSADALRYWSASVNLGNNLNYSEDEVAQGKKLANKLWNASKFIEMHLTDFDCEKHNDAEIINVVDKWILSRLNRVIESATKNFKVYEFAKVRNAVDHFFWLDLCDNYLEIAKDRLYKPEVYGEEQKLSAQITISIILDSIIKLYAPFIPYVTEEIFQGLLRKEGSEKSVHISKWPVFNESFINAEAEKTCEYLVEVVKGVRRYKTENSLSLNTELPELRIKSDAEISKALQNTVIDIKSATRAKDIQFGGEATVKTENFEIYLGITLE
ncbi:MAG: valine--tRNA ligase [Pseudomonadota bacterium]